MPNNWGEGWVATLDIVGFSQRLRTNRDAVLDAYRACLDTLRYAAQHHRDVAQAFLRPNMHELAGFELVIFSDSVFIYPTGDYTHQKPEIRTLAGYGMLMYAKIACQVFLSRGLPCKGGVAYGSFLYEKANSLWMGEAHLDAHHWETAQEWMWVSIAPSSMAYLDEGVLAQIESAYKIAVPTRNGANVSSLTAPPDTKVMTWANPAQIAQCINKELSKAELAGDAKHIGRWRNTASFHSLFLEGVSRCDGDSWGHPLQLSNGQIV
jgi:hypothetical protein